MLKAKLFFIAIIFVTCSAFTSYSNGITDNDDKNLPSLLPGSNEPKAVLLFIDTLYNHLGLESLGLSKQAFSLAFKGYQYFLSKGALKNPDVLTICDYSQSSSNKRLYVIDLVENVVLYNTYVSHGSKTGGEFSTRFSNSNGSHKSNLGFLITAETYRGRAGFSMRFDGQEKGFNNAARKRGIVLHGSKYVNQRFIDSRGYSGRSYGCPAVPMEEYREIIDVIKEGSCFFGYYPDMHYTRVSKILQAKFDWPLLNPYQLQRGVVVKKSTVNNQQGEEK